MEFTYNLGQKRYDTPTARVVFQYIHKLQILIE